MVAFLIVDTKIHDAEAYETYKAQARPIAEKYGGQYRARGGAMEVVEGDLWSPTRLVIIEFPDAEAARAFVSAPEYAPVAKIRHDNATCTSVILEGV
ncbi:MAG: DUF1330 domain-containing protein [Pseudomonadota bacterium]